jgi:hypothetical protein
VIARKETVVDRAQIDELLYQALETELGGEQVYLAAIECAVTDELKKEWQKYLDETRTHQTVLEGVFEVAGLDTATETPGRAIVRQKAAGLVEAMKTALDTTPGVGAQLVAAESVVEAESKDHQNWVLIGLVAESLTGDLKKAFQDAYDEVYEQEGEHLFHTMGWARELWLDSMGLPAALPPPEEEKSVTTQIGAGRAEKARDDYID